MGRIPCGNYQTSTLISGIRWDGPCAPWLFEGPMNGEMFLAWVEQGLAPVLRAGELVILDNLATHKIRGVREAIEARVPGCGTCRPTLRISIPSNRCGARSSRRFAATPRAVTSNCSCRQSCLSIHFVRRLPRLLF